MNKSLRMLIVEDSEDDALLLLRNLRQGGYDTVYQRVETLESMKEALQKQQWDIVVSDYVLPNFSGLAALDVLNRTGLDLPFLIVSGKIGEDVAIETMKAGAHDYIMKENLKRLVPAVERELQDAEVRRERKQAQEALEFSHFLLQLANRHTAMAPLLEEFIEEIKKFSGCTALGIRLLDDEGKIPYEASTGFTQEFYKQEFYKLESPLSLHADRCMCINVVSGTDPALPFYTRGGSFYMNGTTRFLATVSEEIKGETRNACNEFGYESVALIPIRMGEQIIGVLHLADPREDMVPLRKVKILEEVALQLGTAIQRIRAQEGRRKALDAVKVERQRLNDVLETLPAYVALLTPDYHMSFANRFFRERFGESHGRRCFEFLFGRKEPCKICETYTVLKTMSPHRWEWNGPDGRYYDIYDFPFTDTDGATLILELGIDITERKQAQEELKAHTARLEVLNEELRDFAFVAAHDLREPLRKIMTFGDLLDYRHGSSLGEAGKDLLERMIKSSQRMSDLLQALLVYSRISSRPNPFEPTDLVQVAREAISDLELAIEQAGGRVEVGELTTVKVDPSQVRQLIQNLIGNAIKYCRKNEKPVVKVYGKIEDRTYRIFVEDNGIGFDEEYLNRIFRPFQRLHGRSEYEGTGMGLAICRKIAERHGGTITARSTPGQGSTFIVTLPFREGSN